jgi:hypothetical protein
MKESPPLPQGYPTRAGSQMSENHSPTTGLASSKYASTQAQQEQNQNLGKYGPAILKTPPPQPQYGNGRSQGSQEFRRLGPQPRAPEVKQIPPTPQSLQRIPDNKLVTHQPPPPMQEFRLPVNPQPQTQERPRTATIVPRTGPPPRIPGSSVYIPVHMLPTRQQDDEANSPVELPAASIPRTAYYEKPLPPNPAEISSGTNTSTNKALSKLSRLADHVPVLGGILHAPPDRTASPAKSAMKYPSPPTANTGLPKSQPSPVVEPAFLASTTTTIPNEPTGDLPSRRKKSVRINVDVKPGDEDEDGKGVKSSRYAPPTPVHKVNFDEHMSDIMRPRPDLPSFGSVRGEREPGSPTYFGEPARESGKSLLAGNGARREDVGESAAAEAKLMGQVGSSASTTTQHAGFLEQSGKQAVSSVQASSSGGHQAELGSRPLPGSFPDMEDDSDSEDSIYSDAEETLQYTSLDAILEEETPMEQEKQLVPESSFGKGKARAVTEEEKIDSSSLLEKRLEDSRRNSKLLDESSQTVPISVRRTSSPSLQTSKWAPSSPTTQVASLSSDTNAEQNQRRPVDLPQPLRRTGSADSASSFKRNRSSNFGRTTLRTSMRGADNRARTVSPPPMRHTLRPSSPGGGPVRGDSFSGGGLQLRNSLRGGPTSDTSLTGQRESRWKSSRIPSFLRPSKHRRSSSEGAKGSSNIGGYSGSRRSRFADDSDEDMASPVTGRKAFISRFRDDSDDEDGVHTSSFTAHGATPGPAMLSAVPCLEQNYAASSTSLEDSSRDDGRIGDHSPPVPSVEQVNQATGLASSRYAVVGAGQEREKPKRWHSLLKLGHGRRHGSFTSQLSKTLSISSQQDVSATSRPSSSHAANAISAIAKSPSKLRKKFPPKVGSPSRGQSFEMSRILGGRDERPSTMAGRPSLGTRAISMDGTSAIVGREEKRPGTVGMGNRRSTGDELLNVRVLDLIKSNEEKEKEIIPPTPLGVGDAVELPAESKEASTEKMLPPMPSYPPLQHDDAIEPMLSNKQVNTTMPSHPIIEPVALPSSVLENKDKIYADVDDSFMTPLGANTPEISPMEATKSTMTPLDEQLTPLKEKKKGLGGRWKSMVGGIRHKKY